MGLTPWQCHPNKSIFIRLRGLVHYQSQLKCWGLIIVHSSHLWREKLIIELEDRNLATLQNSYHPMPLHLSLPDYIPMSFLKDASKATGTEGSVEQSWHTNVPGWSGLPPHLNNKQNAWKLILDTRFPSPLLLEGKSVTGQGPSSSVASGLPLHSFCTWDLLFLLNPWVYIHSLGSQHSL